LDTPRRRRGGRRAKKKAAIVTSDVSSLSTPHNLQNLNAKQQFKQNDSSLNPNSSIFATKPNATSPDAFNCNHPIRDGNSVRNCGNGIGKGKKVHSLHLNQQIRHFDCSTSSQTPPTVDEQSGNSPLNSNKSKACVHTEKLYKVSSSQTNHKEQMEVVSTDSMHESQPTKAAQLSPNPVVYNEQEHIDQASTYPQTTQIPPPGQFSFSQVVHEEINGQVQKISSDSCSIPDDSIEGSVDSDTIVAEETVWAELPIASADGDTVEINNDALQYDDDDDVTENDLIQKESPSCSLTPDVISSRNENTTADDKLHSNILDNDNCDDNQSVVNDSDIFNDVMDSSDNQSVDSTLMVTDDQTEDVVEYSEGEIVSEVDEREIPSGSHDHYEKEDTVFKENLQERGDRNESDSISSKHRQDSHFHKHHKGSKHHQDSKNDQDILKRRDSKHHDDRHSYHHGQNRSNSHHPDEHQSRHRDLSRRHSSHQDDHNKQKKDNSRQHIPSHRHSAISMSRSRSHSESDKTQSKRSSYKLHHHHSHHDSNRSHDHQMSHHRSHDHSSSPRDHKMSHSTSRLTHKRHHSSCQGEYTSIKKKRM